jgi:hypothetical protein
MGLFDGNWQKLDEMLRAAFAPLLAPGEPLVGCLTATAKSTFSAAPYGIAVTPERLILAPMDRTWQIKGDPVTVRRADILKSSIDGFGGGLSHFLTADLGDIRFDTADKKWKLMALGGGLDQLITGDAQRDGKGAFLEFLYSARHPSS